MVIQVLSYKASHIFVPRRSRDYLDLRKLLQDLMVVHELLMPSRQGKELIVNIDRIVRAFLLEELKELKKMKVAKDQKKKGKKTTKTSKK